MPSLSRSQRLNRTSETSKSFHSQGFSLPAFLSSFWVPLMCQPCCKNFHLSRLSNCSVAIIIILLYRWRWWLEKVKDLLQNHLDSGGVGFKLRSAWFQSCIACVFAGHDRSISLITRDILFEHFFLHDKIFMAHIPVGGVPRMSGVLLW